MTVLPTRVLKVETLKRSFFDEGCSGWLVSVSKRSIEKCLPTHLKLVRVSSGFNDSHRLRFFFFSTFFRKFLSKPSEYFYGEASENWIQGRCQPWIDKYQEANNRLQSEVILQVSKVRRGGLSLFSDIVYIFISCPVNVSLYEFKWKYTILLRSL